MGSKKQPGMFDCYSAALPDEPMFILLARDPDAPVYVRQWASRRAAKVLYRMAPPNDALKVCEALVNAEQMELWRAANDGKWRLPQNDEPGSMDAQRDGERPEPGRPAPATTGDQCNPEREQDGLASVQGERATVETPMAPEQPNNPEQMVRTGRRRR